GGGRARFASQVALAATVAQGGGALDALARAGPSLPLLEALLDRDGLDIASRPKGLVPFHRTPTGPRTAFEEHLAEATELYRDANGRVRLSVTVSAEHLAGFRRVLA